MEIYYDAFDDIRGTLFKPFASTPFINHKMRCEFKEIWFTQSKKNVIRGMHLQTGEFSCNKLITLISGRICDVVLDLRPSSPTFKQYYQIEITAKNRVGLYIPIGCAHGYRSDADDTIVMYAADQVHIPQDDVGVRWNSFGYNWNCRNPIVSERDRCLPALSDSSLYGIPPSATCIAGVI